MKEKIILSIVSLVGLLILVSVLLLSCSHDDNIENAIGPEELLHTTWRGLDVCVEDGEETVSVSFIAEFQTYSKGKYIFVDDDGNSYGDGNFTYKINGNTVTFDGAITGYWTVMERTKNKIKLRAFLPAEHIMTLTKI